MLAVIAPLAGGRGRSRNGPGMLTQPIFSGMNILSLGGFVLMGIGLTLTRQKKARAPAAFALMGIGTALVFLGLYAAPPSAP
jgi:hypothetical protein